MGHQTLAVIHCSPGIPWQGPAADKLCQGLSRLGYRPVVTSSQERQPEGFPILLGTSMWRKVEQQLPFLLVDRCSFGDTNHYVSLVWNGHGRRGDHKVPTSYSDRRWKTHGVEIHKPHSGTAVVLCGQTDSYSPRWSTPEEWYSTHPEATHFRPHPAGDAPLRLPLTFAWEDVKLALTLNSSVAIEALLRGVSVKVDDEGGMAFGWEKAFSVRQRFFEWLSWTQWHWKEITEGFPIRHLFE